jgi:VWFA-related protein
MIDAGHRGLTLLKERPASRARILLFIGQAMDSGSEATLKFVREQAERESISIYAITLPEFGKAFVSDTFSLQGLPRDAGGFKAGVDLGKLIAVLNRSGAADKSADPFSVLTAATGGIQLHFRKQKELENAIATIGVELRSAYSLSYSPSSTETGYHTIKVEVDVPGATVHSRPGYWLGAN